MANIKFIERLVGTPKIANDSDHIFSLTKFFSNLIHSIPRNSLIRNNFSRMDEANQS
jgi:hypothetical protein